MDLKLAQKYSSAVIHLDCRAGGSGSNLHRGIPGYLFNCLGQSQSTDNGAIRKYEEHYQMVCVTHSSLLCSMYRDHT